MPGLLDNSRELAEDKLAALRVQMFTAREAGESLSKEAQTIARELGVTEYEKRLGFPLPESVLGRLASIRLARFRANSDKVSAPETALEARRGVLESALVQLVRDIQTEGNRIVAAQNAYQTALGRFDRDYPSEGAQMFKFESLQPVP
jgi:hypothetical protein